MTADQLVSKLADLGGLGLFAGAVWYELRALRVQIGDLRVWLAGQQLGGQPRRRQARSSRFRVATPPPIAPGDDEAP